MNTIRHTLNQALGQLDAAGGWLGLLSLRLILAWEFGEAGLEKWRGSNWFAEIQDQFPWPFHLIPTDWNWALATGFELAGALALLMGLGTRFFAASLMVLTVVAMLSVHWPDAWSSLAELARGYAFTDKGHGNFKLPVIYLAMLWPLVLMGPGRLSLDALWRVRLGQPTPLLLQPQT